MRMEDCRWMDGWETEQLGRHVRRVVKRLRKKMIIEMKRERDSSMSMIGMCDAAPVRDGIRSF